ncbi:DUF6622 family protein [Shewanella benthica]|uniref:Uncharacterized protein n=1 Tax=Shewanella benthica KT99 TaxID=314608 RepID=A9DF85_9GAMM|nr:hypothetical protein KT99_16911 [Shewanella benthica KT99]
MIFFVLGGSWWPLFLILMIFVFKYVVNVLLATHEEVADQVAFIAGVSLLYGCFSGFFMSRLIVYRSAMKVRTETHV